MQAIVELAVFVGISDDEIVDPDAAVEQLEQLSMILKGLTPGERSTFITFIQGMAHAEADDPRAKERVEFLHSLAENIGSDD
ncbi:hypothetical protein [Reticulibacter mediterranei]|nr:hypothetical protein [Reticulibacter mediterranei]